ncbi:MAG: hypothetical protein P8O22_02265 [Akkermansiaceae bacterium]|nr:hypothetical protein [Akkermansiaceae bacterium]
MFNTKILTKEQIATIKSWVNEGAQLADIQRKMESDLGHGLTYMDTRFLVIDLELELKTDEPDENQSPKETVPAEVDPTELTEDDIEVLPHDSATTNVKVTVDEIARPGVMASGRVTFSDGQAGMWYVDEMGRLGVDPENEGYSPCESDILAFQKELQRVVG